MDRRLTQVGVWLLAACGLGVSLLLLWSYSSDGPGLCGPGGGCDLVRQSKWASLAGIPMPVFGAIYFLVLIAVNSAGPRARRGLVLVAIAGGLCGAALIALQVAVIGSVCPLCMAADVPAILAVPLALIGRGDGYPPRARLIGGVAAVIAALVALGVGSKLADDAPPKLDPERAGEMVEPLPEAVAREQQPGVITIVEFLDFQCPVCRRLHGEMADALEGQSGVRLVRKYVPLDGHEHAIPAALCAACADLNGKGDEVADGLMTADDISAAGCTAVAAKIGLSKDALLQCSNSSESVERIERDVKDAEAAGVQGLPTFFVGNEKFVGFRVTSGIRAAIDRARERQGR